MPNSDFKKNQWIDVTQLRAEQAENAASREVAAAQTPRELVDAVTQLPNVPQGSLREMRGRVLDALAGSDVDVPEQFGISDAVARIKGKSNKKPALGETQQMSVFIEKQIATTQTYRELRNLLDYNLLAEGIDVPPAYILVDDDNVMRVQMSRLAAELENAYQLRDPSLMPDVLGISSALRNILAKEDETKKNEPPVRVAKELRTRRGPTTKNPELAETRKIDRSSFGIKPPSTLKSD